MFAIYNVQGRRFHDTLENLRKVRKSQASSGIKSQLRLANEDVQPVHASTDEISISSNALKTYRETIDLSEREPIYHAHQLMNNPVITIRKDMPILKARRFFQERRVNQMPVMNDQQCIIGMLSVADLLQFIIIDGDRVQYLKGKTVADAMSKEVITAEPVSDIRRVAQVMQEYCLHAIPIVDDRDGLIGIVSRSDILRALTNDPPLNMWS